MFKKTRSTIIIILIALIAIIIIIKVFDKRIEKIEMEQTGEGEIKSNNQKLK
jgi:hypothetical protein